MQTRDFLDQAVFLTSRFDVVLSATRRLPEAALQRFWVDSRTRFDVWSGELRRCTDQFARTDFALDPVWCRWTPLLEEILLSEVVTRIWACLLEALDDRLGLQEYSPIGQSVFRTHCDARRRVLTFLLRGRPRGLPAVWRLNRLRSSAERWTDLLIGSMDPIGEIELHDWRSTYSFDTERSRQLGVSSDRRRMAHAVLAAASRAAFGDSATVAADRALLHSRIHAAMLGCFGGELFLEGGQLMSGWQARMLTLTDDTQGLLDRWLGDAPHDSPRPNRSRDLGRF